ncbi:MAG: caspase family protein [Bacteroidota bacterium]
MLRFLFCLFLLLGIELFAQPPELVAPIGHTDNVLSVAMAPKGQYILTGSSDKSFNLWNRKGHLIQRFETHTKAVKKVVFHPDGQRMMTGSGDGTANLWDLQGNLLQTIKPNAGAINSIAFSQSGDSVLFACQGRAALLYTLKGEFLKQFHAPKLLAVHSVAFSPNGRYVMLGGNSVAGVADIRNPQTIIQAPGDHVHIWELISGKHRSFGGHLSQVSSIAFSPDGTRFLSASKDSTLLIRDLNGNILHQRSWTDMYVASATFSPNGQQVLFGGIDAGIWDLASDTIKPLAPSEEKTVIWDVRYTPDGKQIMAAGSRRIAYLWDLNGELLQEFKGHSLSFRDATFSPDGTHILSGSVEAKLWDLREPLVQRLPGMEQGITSVVFSADGQHILAGGFDRISTLWDRDGKEVQQVFQGDTSFISSVGISRDGQSILTASENGSATLWNRDGTAVSKIVLKPKRTANYFGRNKIYEAALSPDGQHFLVADWEMDVARLYDRSGTQLQEFPVKGNPNVMEQLHFSPDGSQFALGERTGRISLYRINGKKIRSFELDVNWLTCMAFSDDWERIVVGSADGTIWLLNSKGKELLRFQGHRNMIRTVDISPDGRFLLSGGNDHQLKIWNLQSQEVASLISLSEGDWVVRAPSGLFDASPAAMEKMHFNQGLNIIELEQLKERYYEPGLLSKLLGYSDSPVRDVAVFGELALYPSTQLSVTNDILHIHLIERSGGIGKVSVFINQKEVMTDVNPDRQTDLKVNLRQFKKYYRPGKNEIAVRVYNSEGWLKSEAIDISYQPSFSQISSHQTSLYAVSIGTSNYNGESLDLQFASDDAQDMATAISSSAKQLFGDRVHSYILTTESGPEHLPSKSNIQQTLQKIAEQAFPQDILLLFLSGHGVTYGSAEKTNFYYLTKDIASEDLSDTEIRNNYAISDEELTSWINEIAAMKQVMIVDACNSGKVVENLLSGRKSLNSNQVIALDRMKDRTGMYVLAGSAADKSSFEATEFRQGLLTYSLLSGMKGVQLNEPVDIMKLFQFSRDEVPKLAKRINGIQTPMLAFPGSGASFDIGIITAEVDIPIGQEVPRMLPSVFLDREEINDWLNISVQLNQILRDYSLKKGKDKLMYTPSMMPDASAYSVRGLYTVEGDQLQIEIRLRKGEELLSSFELTGSQADAPKLVRQMMGEIVKKL